MIWLQNNADHYFVQMLDALNSQGGDVEYVGVFLCPPPQGNVLFQVPKLAPYVFLGDPAKHGGPHGYKKLGKQAREYIKKLEFSAAIVGGYDSLFKLWVLRHCQSRGIPTAMFADSNIRAERGRKLKERLWRSAKRLFLRGVTPWLNLVIPMNRSGVAYWRYYGTAVNKIICSTSLCAVNTPAALAVNREELFRRYQLDPNRKLIFTAARLVPVKALHLMVDAFANSGLADQGWVWAVAGDGPLRQELESQVTEQSRRDGTIRFLGPVAPTDIPGLMAQSELFVLPSVYEPHGIAVTEAMAVGTPVIAADCCGAARDLVRRGRTGWLFKTGDLVDLRAVLRLATDTTGTLSAMRSACREEFARWYGQYSPLVTIPQIAEKLLRRRVVPRLIWLQNSADHYFVQMLDALNAQGNVEYFGVFLCPPPLGNLLFQVPKSASYVFLGDPVKHGGPHGYKKLGKEAREYIKKLDFSAAIVGGYDSLFKLWVLRHCQSRGIPTAMFADSNIRAERGRKLKKRLWRSAKRLFLRTIINRVDRIIPCNRSGVAYWHYYGCPASKIARSTYFCAVDIPAALGTNREELFARYQLDPKCKLIFTAARLVPAKALHLMIEAFANSGLAEKGWVWAVAGAGPLRQELESQAGNLNGKAIRFLGPVKPADIPGLMAQSQLFVLPSIYEPHGIVVTEAMAVGTPVIAGDCCGAARDLVRAGRTGWLFKTGDAASLQTVLATATRDAEQLAAMRGACSEEFRKWYGKYGPVRAVPGITADFLAHRADFSLPLGRRYWLPILIATASAILAAMAALFAGQ